MSSLPEPGTGYFVSPEQGHGPPLLLLCSAWGLTDALRAKANELADSGFTVLAPDLNDGATADNPEQAQQLLLEANMNVTASLVQSSLRLLLAATPDAGGRAGVVGFGSGASWGLWISERLADQCAAVVSYYGSQSISFEESESSYLLHFADDDPNVTDEEVATLGLNLQLARRDFRVERHVGVGHGFAEADHPSFDAAAEVVAWRQTLEFLADRLRPVAPNDLD